MRPRSPTRWCACSSITATAPTAPRRGSNMCSTRWAWRNFSVWWRKSSAASSTAPCPVRWRRARLFDRTAHIGIHAQKQEGLHWIGVVVPVGYLTVAQMRGLADIAQEFGDGDIRLTVWQNSADFRRADGKTRSRASRKSRRSVSRSKPTRSAPGWSPAPAIPDASSRPRTPSVTPRRSRAGARPACRSIRR